MSKKKSAFKCLALVAALAALQGCGGGGGGGFALPVQADGSAKDSGPIAADGMPTPSPDPSSPGTDPVVVDPTVCITEPQPGSTAAVGNGLEGLWQRREPSSGAFSGLMLIDPGLHAQGWISSDLSPTSFDNFDGLVSFSAPNASWQFDSGVLFYGGTQVSLSGQGSYAPKSTLSGGYTGRAGAQSNFGPFTYDTVANSLAISPALLEGTWGAFGPGPLQVNADGTFTGSTHARSIYGACALSGTLLLSEPGSRKNSINVALVATNAAQAGEMACSLDAYSGATGAVIVSQNTDTQTGSCRQTLSLYLFLRDASGRYTGSTIGFFGR